MQAEFFSFMQGCVMTNAICVTSVKTLNGGPRAMDMWERSRGTDAEAVRIFGERYAKRSVPRP